MTNQKMIVTLTLIGLATIAILAYFATLGNVWAYALLFAAWTVGCICLGWALSFVQTKAMADKQQQDFIANAKENMEIISSIQSVQNKQNSSVMQQLGQAARLPDQADQGLLIDNIIFDEII